MQKLMKFIVMKEDSLPSVIWYFLSIICCVASSYFFALKAIEESVIIESHMDEKDKTLIYVELFFIFDICKKFITEYKEEGKEHPETDLSKIATHYLKTNFAYDLLLWFPFNYLIGHDGLKKNLYLIKALRIIKALQIFNISQIVKAAQNHSRRVRQ